MIAYDFSEVTAAGWNYIMTHRGEIDPKTCAHSCIAKERGGPRRRIVRRLIIEKDDSVFDVEIYNSDVCHVCQLEIGE